MKSLIVPQQWAQSKEMGNMALRTNFFLFRHHSFTSNNALHLILPVSLHVSFKFNFG